MSLVIVWIQHTIHVFLMYVVIVLWEWHLSYPISSLEYGNGVFILIDHSLLPISFLRLNKGCIKTESFPKFLHW